MTDSTRTPSRRARRVALTVAVATLGALTFTPAADALRRVGFGGAGCPAGTSHTTTDVSGNGTVYRVCGQAFSGSFDQFRFLRRCPEGTVVQGSHGHRGDGLHHIFGSFRPSPIANWAVTLATDNGWLAWSSSESSNGFEWYSRDDGAVGVTSHFVNWWWWSQPLSRLVIDCGRVRNARIAQADDEDAPPPGDEVPTGETGDVNGTDGADDFDAPPDGSDFDVFAGDGEDEIDGGSGDDELSGGSGDDEIDGGSGDDMIFGGEGDDVTDGGGGDDHMEDGPGDDRSSGGPGDDTILTGPGNDVANGGSGNDDLFDRSGRDRLNGGSGDDNIAANDGNADVIVCGRGRDVVVADRRDRVHRSCEFVFRSRREAPRTPPRTRNRP